MYRVKSNGLDVQLSIYTESEQKEHIIQKQVLFRKEQSQIVVYCNGERIGDVRIRKEIATIQHILEHHLPYYAWVQSINRKIVQISVVRPTEIVTGVEKIAINLSKLDGSLNRELYISMPHSPFPHQIGLVYIAYDEQNKRYYLFSNEPKKGSAKVLVLIWEQDQLFAVAEEPITYKPEEKKRLLKKAKLFDTMLILRDTIQGEQLETELNFHEHFSSVDKYLDAWKQYMNYERDLLTQKQQQCKLLQYNDYDYVYGKLTFYLEGKNDLSGWLDQVEQVSVEIPSSEEALQVGVLKYINGYKLEVDFMLDDTADRLRFPKKGNLQVSTLMNEVAQRRRDIALQKTMASLSVISNLGTYLSEPEKVPPMGAIHYRFPSADVPTLVNGCDADIQQRLAIEAALNTNDLVLIQGPPGTGKTSVIQTIMKSLIALGMNDILLTSYQHLAVDNAMEGLIEHGMSAHRFGGEKYVESELKTYRRLVNEMASRVTFDDVDIQQNMPYYEKLLQDVRDFLAQAPFTPATLTTLRQYMEGLEGDEELPISLILTLDELLALLKEEQYADVHVTVDIDPVLQSQFDKLPKAVARIRSTKDVEQWQVFLKNIALLQSKERHKQCDILITDIKKTRQQLVIRKDSKALQENLQQKLDELVVLVSHLFTQQAATSFSSDELVGQLQRIIVEVEMLIEESQQVVALAEQAVISEFMRQIKADPLELAKCIRQYAQVKGTTCQQTVAQRHRLYDVIFDAVIIDEAARANPLDVLIPMTLGKKVILVGDHKQLPHILEPAFEKEVDLPPDEFDKMYAQSLFERLYQNLAVGKKVMLNKQFRMHEDIGELVSQLFYPEGLYHGQPAGALQNDTSLYNGKHLAWIDVSLRGQGEQGRYVNEHEVDVLIEQVKKLLKSSPQYNGHIGIISFYNEQLVLLNKKLKNAGLEQAVQSGTVDAFQGKEFDIVFLTTVRSNRYQGEARALGFLRSPNRFNVALSRARKLIVIVGDAKTLCHSNMFQHAYDYVKERGYIEHY